MASSSRSSPRHLALNDEEALIHNFDGVSLGSGPSSERMVIENHPWHFDHCLMVFANLEGLNLLQPKQLRCSFEVWFKRDPFDLANSIPFEEMNLRSLAQNHDLQDVVNQFLPQASLPSSLDTPITLAPADNQVHSSSPTSSQEVVTSDSQFSGLQSLLCAVSQASLNEPSTTIHIDKGKGIQASDSFVPHFSPRALSIGGGSGLLQAYDKAQTFHNPNSFEDSQEGSQNSFTPDAPKVGSFKLLVDAAISNQLQKIGIGASVFDSKSDIVATMSSPCDGVLPPLLAKAKALLWVLRWCIAVEFPLDRIETDSQLLVRKVRHRWKDKSPLFDLVNQIKACLSFLFPMSQ
ncbi:hypothetical protein F8388_002831 [Cannabis sativa]|uniref:RNase H type-1 domain-containing protein n=1 Tax=Cannabis sativa TaxID=3483 RepID=A0A7J6EFU4_CANSA|nr:hypothetical protein F8388_002831 [Cannabis sativa]